MRKNVTEPSNILAANRRLLATELRTTGLTYREIAVRIQAQAKTDDTIHVWAGYGERDAHRDVTTQLKTVVQEQRETTEEFITLELTRLDKITKGCNEIIDDPEQDVKYRLAAMDRLLKSQERRAKLLGLDVVPKAKEADWKSEFVMLILNNQLTIEQLRKEFPELADEVIKQLPQSRGASPIEVRAIEAASEEVETS